MARTEGRDAYIARLSDYEAALIDVLWDRDWHTQQELIEATSFRFGSVIHSLRGKGMDIRTKHAGGTKFMYRLEETGDWEIVDED